MLQTLLRAVRQARDLGPVLASLGYDVPPCEPGQEAPVVAQWRGYRIVAVDDDAALERARRMARGFTRSAERALAVAVGNGVLAMAAPRLGGGPVAARLVSLAHPTGSDVHQLESLRPRPDANALAHALRVVEALSSEPVGHRFFAAFRVVLERMAATLDGRTPESDRRLAALLALTRVLFLYFIQAKGWLDGRPNYLPTLLDDALARRRHFHRSALHPLFFGTLNRPPAARSARLNLGRIPYLNGGLFEPHPVERRVGPVIFPNALWRDAFDTLFERFRFCVRETEAADAIAPDMLGHVFERVMDAGERHRTGTFYTPETVVRQIVTATIDAALAGATDLPSLERLRVLDPAVGSGAFLLGALAYLTDRRRATSAAAARSVRAVRLDVLRHNLFGIDVSPVAVRLAELRLWLAVVADDATSDIADVAPLPNLDGVVRQGNALLDPVGLARAYDLAPLRPPPAAVRAVAIARRRLFVTRGPARRDAASALREREGRLARHVLRSALASCQAARRDLRSVAESHDLFGRRRGLDPSQRRRWTALTELRAQLRRLAAQLRDGAVPFFSFDTHVPDVVAEGGFSAVVGNPPWVRAERLTAAERTALTRRFSWWHAGHRKGFAHQPDLAVAFLQRAVELARPGGAVGFLVPSKIATALYGETARRHLVRETELLHVHRVPHHEAQRFGAATYPLAVVARKAAPGDDHVIGLSLSSRGDVRQVAWAGGAPWILVPDRTRDALERLRGSGTPLAAIAEPALGLKTGADAVFVGQVRSAEGSLATVRFGHRDAAVETEVLRPVVRGRDLTAFRVTPSRVLLWGYGPDGPLGRLPRHAAAYLATHAAVLANRSDYRRGPLWTLFRTAAATRPHRVVWADIAARPYAVALDEVLPAAVPLNTCYVAPCPDRDTALVLSAVLNSTWIAALVRAVGDEALGGYRRVNAHVVRQVPLPHRGPHYAQLAELAATAHTSHVSQSDLDAAVAAALDLPAATCRALAELAAHDRAHRR